MASKRAANRGGARSLERKAGRRKTAGRAPHGPSKNRDARRQSSQKTTRITTQIAAKPGSLWEKALRKKDRELGEKGQGLVRINLHMARCGVASRRSCDELVSQGRVSLNGKTVKQLGTKVDPLRDRIVVDDEVLKPEKPTYVLLNKPQAVVCTNSSREKKTRAVDLLDGVRGRLFSVGRLDADSEGLLLMTNDGLFSELMTHPRYCVPKVYHLTLRGRIEQSKLDKLRAGVWIAEGKTQGVTVKLSRRSRERSFLEVTIREGKNRELRRIFARIGHPVLRLTRVRIASLTLSGLKSGQFRFLRQSEVDALVRAAKG